MHASECVFSANATRWTRIGGELGCRGGEGRLAPGDDAADYLRRGRAFAQLDLATLRTQWVDAMRRWSRDLLNAELVQQHDDLQAELGLRKEEPPFELVHDELK